MTAERKRWLGVVLGIPCAWLAAAFWLTSTPPATVMDEVSALTPVERTSLERRLAQIRRESGVDIRVVLTALADRDGLERNAAQRFDALAIGRGHGDGRGLLLLHDQTTERLRLEVGYDLEALFPDSFADRLLQDHARHLFAEQRPADALRFALRLIEHRVRTASLTGRFDPVVFEHAARLVHGSGGGGASARTDGPVDRGLLDQDLPPWDRAALTAAPTVEDALQRLVDWIGSGHFDVEVDLFTEPSRSLLARIPATPAMLEHVLSRLTLQTFEILERGDLALAVAVADPLEEPIFLRRSIEGWQIDLASASEEVITMAGGAHTWSLRGGDHPYARAFADELVMVAGALRIRSGDNRALP